MKTFVRWYAVLLAAGTLFGAACGESDEQRLRTLVNQVANSDPAICEHIGERVRKTFFEDIEHCRNQLSHDTSSQDLVVRAVKVNGDRATVSAKLEGRPSRYEFVKRDGDWKVAGFTLLKPKPKIQLGLTARQTVDAYYAAIKGGDGRAFCGLVSRRYAKRVADAPDLRSAIQECVQEAQGFDWSEIQDEAAGVMTRKVKRFGEGATVTLSNGSARC